MYGVSALALMIVIMIDKITIGASENRSVATAKLHFPILKEGSQSRLLLPSWKCCVYDAAGLAGPIESALHSLKASP